MRRALRGAAVDHVVGARRGLAAARLMRLPGGRIAAGDPRPRRSPAARASGTPRRARRRSAARVAAARPSRRPTRTARWSSPPGATGPAKGVVYRHRQVRGPARPAARRPTPSPPDDRLVAAFAPFALLGPGAGHRLGGARHRRDRAGHAHGRRRWPTRPPRSTPPSCSPRRRRCATSPRPRPASPRASGTALAGVRLLMSAGAPVPAALLAGRCARCCRAAEAAHALRHDRGAAGHRRLARRDRGGRAGRRRLRRPPAGRRRRGAQPAVAARRRRRRADHRART